MQYICIFVMSIVEFSCLFCNTKISEFFDMTKSWAARLCRLPKQVTGSAERLRYLKSLSYNSVAELRDNFLVQKCSLSTKSITFASD